MKTKNVVDVVREQKVVAILRGLTADQTVRSINLLVEEGIRLVEITTNTESVFDIVADHAYDENAIIGVGTVRNVRLANKAIASGARFIVSPNLDFQVLKRSIDAGIICIPGVLSPTEIETAWQAGVRLVKIFPVIDLGPSYIKSLRGPFPDVEMIPTGGIDTGNAHAFLNAGATALGIGGGIIDRTAIEKGDWETQRQRIQDVLAALHLPK